MADQSECIRIGVRLRPLVPCEAGQPQCLRVRDNVIILESDGNGSKAPREFAFDYVMDSSDATSGSFVSQERCYQLMAEKMVEHSLQGFSTCLFCYGQTGTGKTTTILGKPEPTSEQGLLLRLVTDLFQQVSILGEQVQCRVQIVEVHNERVRDLLTEGNDSQNPEVHVHPQLGVYLKHAVDQPVQSLDACLGIIEDASGRQTVASTAMNSQSSRGHTVYKLSVERHGGDNTVMTSEVFFVDLAGRENERTTRVSGERLVELSFINRSLMWLSQCIYALGNTASGRRSKRLSRLNGEERRSGSFRLSSLRDSKELTRSSMISEDSDATPHRRGSKAENNTMARFRNSKLTLLLAKALSGNSKTSVICTLSPAKANAEESCTTLNFAASLKSVKVFATPATRIDKDSLISGLQSELQELRQQLSADNSVELSSQLEVANGMLEKYRASWQQKIKENQQLRQQCSSALQRLGLARSRIAGRSLTPDPYLALEGKKAREGRPSCPHLASYDDPERSGRMIFPVTDKSEFSLGSAPECHFVLPERHGIAPRCAYLWLEDDRLFIRASNGIPVPRVEVNHQRLAVDEVKELFHGDFLVFGSACCFFVCLDDLAVSDSHRVRKLPAWWALGMKERTKVMQEILDSDATSKELQVALHYMSVLQSQNLDSEGLRNLDKFLGSAKRAAELVSEGNALTGALKPLSKLKLELSSIAPVMLYGYGDNCGVPELCIRLVKDLRPKMPEVETLAFWTLAQFQVRLRIMRELHEKRLHSPDTFALDARADPWAEHAVPSSSRRMGASELRGEIHSEAAKVGVGTSSLAQDADRLFIKMDNLLSQQALHSTAAAKDERSNGVKDILKVGTHTPSSGLRPVTEGARCDDRSMRRKPTSVAVVAEAGESPVKPRSRSLGRGEVDSFANSDPLADASTSFSSGYLTAEFSISPGIPEAESYNVIDQLGDASPSFSSSSHWESSWSKSYSARHLGAEKDRILGIPTQRIVRAPAPPASWIAKACFSGLTQVPGAYTVPVPDGACQNLGGSTGLPSRGPSSPRTDQLWGSSSVPVSTAKGSKTCQASLASTPGLLTGMVSVQDWDSTLEPPENPFENTKQIPWNCRWTVPAHTRPRAETYPVNAKWHSVGQ